MLMLMLPPGPVPSPAIPQSHIHGLPECPPSLRRDTDPPADTPLWMAHDYSTYRPTLPILLVSVCTYFVRVFLPRHAANWSHIWPVQPTMTTNLPLGQPYTYRSVWNPVCTSTEIPPSPIAHVLRFPFRRPCCPAVLSRAALLSLLLQVKSRR
ncbi:hypothetical protein LY76DRAFT_358381 [Colletotrichum caudatum]|nr:hypothetical protein LY76DRAFT_358381 [Colletotrichum caudatum]